MYFEILQSMYRKYCKETKNLIPFWKWSLEVSEEEVKEFAKTFDEAVYKILFREK